ncbi:MAG: hypothetical protein QM500_08940 [Methylococcales bacterium]
MFNLLFFTIITLLPTFAFGELTNTVLGYPPSFSASIVTVNNMPVNIVSHPNDYYILNTGERVFFKLKEGQYLVLPRNEQANFIRNKSNKNFLQISQEISSTYGLSVQFITTHNLGKIL